MIRSATLQRIAEIVMVLGIIALCQPWSFLLHRYGLTVVLIGLIGFMITGKIGPEPNPQQVEMEGGEGPR